MLSFYGVLVLGVGDALVSPRHVRNEVTVTLHAPGYKLTWQASIIGRRVGKVKWCAAGGKTLEGSVAFVGSVLVSTMFLWSFGMVRNINVCHFSSLPLFTAGYGYGCRAGADTSGPFWRMVPGILPSRSIAHTAATAILDSDNPDRPAGGISVAERKSDPANVRMGGGDLTGRLIRLACSLSHGMDDLSICKAACALLSCTAHTQWVAPLLFER